MNAAYISMEMILYQIVLLLVIFPIHLQLSFGFNQLQQDQQHLNRIGVEVFIQLSVSVMLLFLIMDIVLRGQVMQG